MVIDIVVNDRDADKDIKKTKSKVKDLDKTSKKTKRSLGAMAGKIAGVVAGLTALAYGVKKAVDAYAEQEKAERKLAAAMKSTNSYTEQQFENFKKLASEIQSLTVYGDEQTLQYMQMAKSLGVTNDNMEKVIKGAIGLSNTLGLGLRQSIRYVSTAMQGEYTILQRYIPQLRQATTDAEKMAIVQRKMAEGFKVAKDEANTNFGKIEQLKNSFGDLQERLGKFVIPALTKVVDKLKKIVNHWNKVLKIGGKGGPKVIAQDSLTQLSNYVNKYKEELKNLEVADEKYANAYEMYMARIMKYNKEWQKETKKTTMKVAGQTYKDVNVRKTEKDYERLDSSIKEEEEALVTVLKKKLGIEAKITDEKQKQNEKTKENQELTGKEKEFLDDKLKWQYEHQEISLSQYKAHLQDRLRTLEQAGEKYSSTWQDYYSELEELNENLAEIFKETWNTAQEAYKELEISIGLRKDAGASKDRTENYRQEIDVIYEFKEAMATMFDADLSGAEKIKNVMKQILTLFEFAIMGAVKVNEAMMTLFTGPLGIGVALAGLALIEAAKAGIDAMSFAEGGVVDGPTLALLGEAGQREFVTPEITFEKKFDELASKLIAGSGSGEYHYHFDNPLTTEEAAKDFHNKTKSYDGIRKKTTWKGKE